MKHFLQKVARHIWAYLICIFAFAVLWNGVFGFLTRIPASEKVTVFIAARSTTYAHAEELSARRPDGLRAVDVRCAIPDTMYFDVYLSIWGYTQGDILILPETLLDTAALSDRFSPIGADCAEALGGLGTLEADGIIYGIRVHDAETHHSLISGIEWGEGDAETNYYLLFGRDSVHLGDLPGSGTATADDAAVRVAELLMQL